MGLIRQISEYLISTVGYFNYFGIFILMAIESTIFPLPSELVLIPAGVLVSRGEMNAIIIVICSVLGSVLGSLIMYFLALHFGRTAIDKLIKKYGKLMFLDMNTFSKSELYFEKHGEITIFISRLLPVIRHLISIPAGFARMNILKFILYTAFGTLLWSAILVYLGYSFGIALAAENIRMITYLLAGFCIIIIGAYILIKKKKNL